MDNIKSLNEESLNPELKELYEKLKEDYFMNYMFGMPCVYEGFTYTLRDEYLFVIDFDDSVVVNGKVTIPTVFDLCDFIDDMNVNVLSLKSNVKELDLGRCFSVLSHQFSGCHNLEKVTGNLVVDIKDGGFSNCISLREVDFPSLIFVGNNAFRDDINLREINFNVAKSVGDCAFMNCSNLEKASLPGVRFSKNNYSNNQFVTSVFEGCKSLKEVDVSGATMIGPRFFYECSSLQELYVPLNMVFCEESLAGCLQLHTLYLDNLIGFKAHSLLACDNLKFVNFYGNMESWSRVQVEDENEVNVFQQVKLTLDYKDPVK